MPTTKPSRSFSLFGLAGNAKSNATSVVPPSLKLHSDKDVYRAGDPVVITIEIRNPSKTCSLLLEKLAFEIKGIEKLDPQWFSIPKSFPQSKQRRGEHIFMEYSTPAIVSNQILSSEATKLYVARTFLPSIVPPSYKGSAIRYLYYVRCRLAGQYLNLENGHFKEESIHDIPEVEARVPLQIWVTQENNGLLADEGQSEGIVPPTTITLDVYWKDANGDSDWARANEIYDGIEEGYDSSRDEISSISSYNLSKENVHKAFGSSLSLQSSAARSSTKDVPYLEENNGAFSYVAQHRVAADVSYPSTSDAVSPQKSSDVISPDLHMKHDRSLSMGDESAGPSVSEAFEPTSSEGFVRGRSYNIRLDDQVLLRFSPKNSDSSYYFSDMIGGTLTFFHEEGSRRCLEISITLEMYETINHSSVHPSRRHCSSITKVQSDHQEFVADLVQTSFLFSIPMDGPMSFSTRNVSVHWALRFEFFTTPKNADLSRFEHPLLIDGREKCEWVLPITVHAPPVGTHVANARKEKASSLEPLWVRT